MRLLIKVILFDFGGVVVPHIGNERDRRMSKLSGLGLEDVKKLERPIEYRCNKGLISFNSFCKLVSKKLGVGSYKKIKQIYIDTKKREKVNKKVIRIVERLKEKGYEVAILSNTCTLDADINRRHGYYDTFSPLIFSHKVGCRKPEKKIFQIALKKLNVKPNECIFIDDKENKMPPKSLGIKTILFKNAEQLEDDLRKMKIL